jgi:hypothetical protein
MKFVHTFSPWNTHIEVEASVPARMKPADASEEVLFREALMEGRRRTPQLNSWTIR